MNYLKYLKNFHFLAIIIFSIVFAYVVEPYLPLEVKSFFVSCSNLIRSFLLFLLPILIFPYIANTFIQLKSQGIILVIFILICVCLSNFCAILIGYFGNAMVISNFTPVDILKTKLHLSLTPIFEISLPQLISVEKTIIYGFLSGVFINLLKSPKVDTIFNYYLKIVNFFFQKIMSPLIPIYIFGIIIKMNHEMDLSSSLSLFSNIFLIIILIQILYLFILFFISSNFDLKETLTKINNSLLAGVTGFSTMSRVVSLPVILNAAEKNSSNTLIPKVTEPMIMNSHAIGECISLPIIILTLLKINNLPIPDFTTYLEFAVIMTIAQFSAVSIPGGSLIVLMPFLNSYFGLTNDMIALMFAFDIFFDSVGTAMNTFGDLAFISFIDKIYKKFPKLNKNLMNNK